AEALDANVLCTSASSCPGSDTECRTRTCIGGVCGFAYAQSGTPLAAQTAGDCRRNVCDGAGNVTTGADGNDIPGDNTPCTQDLCMSGPPSTPALAAGTMCSTNGGQVCDGAGACVQCVAPTDCPGTDGDCVVRSCMQHQCGTAFVAAGTPVGTQ